MHLYDHHSPFLALDRSSSPWFLWASLPGEKLRRGKLWGELLLLMLPFVLRSQTVPILSHLHYPISIPLPISCHFCSFWWLTWWGDPNFHSRGVLVITFFSGRICCLYLFKDWARVEKEVSMRITWDPNTFPPCPHCVKAAPPAPAHQSQLCLPRGWLLFSPAGHWL